ncbi:hypothetical protein H5410_042397 [Solanum commersonii]|uniref:Uncharacterized protein n=1 Tax=Solanum commersonii TaxID=4109 RepID=A0A9J5XU76_SOLCO|nr:hypothetical protein H5410_042397 [Solanum commersonii]
MLFVLKGAVIADSGGLPSPFGDARYSVTISPKRGAEEGGEARSLADRRRHLVEPADGGSFIRRFFSVADGVASPADLIWRSGWRLLGERGEKEKNERGDKAFGMEAIDTKEFDMIKAAHNTKELGVEVSDIDELVREDSVDAKGERKKEEGRGRLAADRCCPRWWSCYQRWRLAVAAASLSWSLADGAGCSVDLTGETGGGCLEREEKKRKNERGDRIKQSLNLSAQDLGFSSRIRHSHLRRRRFLDLAILGFFRSNRFLNAHVKFSMFLIIEEHRSIC